MKSTKDSSKKAATESTGKQTNDSKPGAGKEETQSPRSQGTGTSGRRKPPPPGNGNLKQGKS